MSPFSSPPALISHSAVQTATGPLYALYEINANLIKVLQMERRQKASLYLSLSHTHTQVIADFLMWFIVLINLSGYLMTQELEAEMNSSSFSTHLTFSYTTVPCSLLLSVLTLSFLMSISPSL